MKEYVIAILIASSPVVIPASQQGGVGSKDLPPRSVSQSPDWNVRRNAFLRLTGVDQEAYRGRGTLALVSALKETLVKSPDTANERKELLFELLKVENAEIEKRQIKFASKGPERIPKEDQLSEAQTNYYADLIAAVTSVGDPRSLDVVVGAIATGGMATRTLVSFGRIAVKPIAQKLKSPDVTVRAAVARTLSQMLERSPDVSKDPASRETIKQTLLLAAADPYFTVRMAAIDGLVRLGDQHSIDLVERMSRTDPFRGDEIPGLRGRYIVREAATKALKEHALFTPGRK